MLELGQKSGGMHFMKKRKIGKIKLFDQLARIGTVKTFLQYGLYE
jgi:hypothetical protein